VGGWRWGRDRLGFGSDNQAGVDLLLLKPSLQSLIVSLLKFVSPLRLPKNTHYLVSEFHSLFISCISCIKRSYFWPKYALKTLRKTKCHRSARRVGAGLRRKHYYLSFLGLILSIRVDCSIASFLRVRDSCELTRRLIKTAKAVTGTKEGDNAAINVYT